jgi:hypothetical protein
VFFAHHEYVVAEVILHDPAQQIEGQVGAGMALNKLSCDCDGGGDGQLAHHVGAVVHSGAADVHFDPAKE